uniref:Inhibitor of growth protein n=1 Tax=Strigamia maritima TaxID=126957 RepID=T1IYD5_STRMM
MLYLEDYLEIIEHLPQELRDRFTEMREMDLQVQNAMDSLDERVKQLFAQAKKLKPEQREADYNKLRQDYYKALEDADEKVQIANQIYDLVDRYLRRLDQELQKFKMELEADNAGITEILERRSLELDNPPQPLNHQQKSEKRKYSVHSNSVNHHEKRMSIDKLIPPPSIEQIQEPPVKYRSSSGSSTPILSATTTVSNHTNTNPVAVSNPVASVASVTTPPVQQPSIAYSLGHIGAGSNAIAAAASQAIAATQQVDRNSQARVAPLESSTESDEVNCPNVVEESGQGIDWTYDPNEPRYCICNQVSYGDMVACDNTDCPFEWFHYACVNITQPPKGKWYCPQCISAMRRRGRKEK